MLRFHIPNVYIRRNIPYSRDCYSVRASSAWICVISEGFVKVCANKFVGFSAARDMTRACEMRADRRCAIIC